jgi:beta-galactosidase
MPAIERLAQPWSWTMKDEANAVVNRRLPGLLAGLAGVEVEEYDSLSPDMQNGLEFVLPELAATRPLSAGVWCDVLKPNGATVVARYTHDYYAGQPAITLNRWKAGQVIYVGTVGDESLYETLAGWLSKLAGVQPLLSAPEGIEVAERWQGDRRLLFVLNHTGQEQPVTLEGVYTDLLGGSTIEGVVSVAPRDVLVLEKGSRSTV